MRLAAALSVLLLIAPCARAQELGRLFFTPFPGEPVGWMIEQCGDELFCFSSDYPHPEGTKNPIARFEASLAGVGDEAKERFYSRNFAELFALT